MMNAFRSSDACQLSRIGHRSFRRVLYLHLANAFDALQLGSTINRHDFTGTLRGAAHAARILNVRDAGSLCAYRGAFLLDTLSEAGYLRIFKNAQYCNPAPGQ